MFIVRYQLPCPPKLADPSLWIRSEGATLPKETANALEFVFSSRVLFKPLALGEENDMLLRS